MGRAIAVIVLLIAIGGAAVYWIYRGPAAPVDQIAAAKQRVQESISRSEAHRYAPEAVASVQRALEDVDRSVAVEQKKLPFQRNYDNVLQQLQQIDGALQDLETQARRTKEQMSNDVATDIDNLRATAATISRELGDMPTAKGSRPALGAMRTDLAAVNQAIEDVQALLDAEQFQQASQKASQVQEQADTLLSEILETKERVRALRQRTGP